MDDANRERTNENNKKEEEKEVNFEFDTSETDQNNQNNQTKGPVLKKSSKEIKGYEPDVAEDKALKQEEEKSPRSNSILITEERYNYGSHAPSLHTEPAKSKTASVRTEKNCVALVTKNQPITRNREAKSIRLASMALSCCSFQER